MAPSSHHGTGKMASLSEFNRSYQIVLSSCRLLTEAQFALDRSIKDFVAIAEAQSPTTNLEYVSPNTFTGTVPRQDIPQILEEPSQKAAEVSAHPPNVVRKKEKKERDPAMPKRPASAFFLFQNAIRNSVKSAMPEEAKGLEIQKAVSEKWRDLDEAGRKPYIDQHEREVHEFSSRLAAYNAANGIITKTKSVAKKVPSEVSTEQRANDDDAAAASLVQSNVQEPLEPQVKASKKRSKKSGDEVRKAEKANKETDRDASGESKKKKKKSDKNA